MMNELFQQIESGETAARIGVTSGFRQFLAALSSETAMRALSRRVSQHPEDAISVFRRLARLAEQQIDTRYEHPADTALSAYLIVLGLADEALHNAAVEAVLGARNTWWARRVAEAVRQPGTAASANVMLEAFSLPFSQTDSYEAIIPAIVRYSGWMVVPSEIRITVPVGSAETTWIQGQRTVASRAFEAGNADAVGIRAA